MNIREMELLAGWLEELPAEHFDINRWIDAGVWSNSMTEADLNVCGTTCCVAGLYLLRKGYKVFFAGSLMQNGQYVGTVADMAQNMLGLCDWQVALLFYNAWETSAPSDFVFVRERHPTNTDAARLARALIEYELSVVDRLAEVLNA